MKRKIAIIILAATLISVFGTFCVTADFGSGMEAVSESEVIIKSGLLGKKITFSDADFKQGLTITDFDSITITTLPPSNEGTLMLAGRRVSQNMKIRAKNIGALVFIPASRDVKESKFGFTISPYADGCEIDFQLKFTDKINYEPEIDTANQASILTQRDISIFGKMSAKDKEGDKLEFIIVKYPEHGTIELSSRENGEFCYTPHSSFVGDDSFSYVARDEWGNFSTVATMSVSVKERMSEVVYLDMKNSREYNAAVALCALGIMEGKLIGDARYFQPEEKVTKAEFVTMLMKTLNIKKDTTLTATYFDDNDKIPTALIPYVATAQRAGLISGAFEDGELNFHPNEAITNYEAASIIKKALGNKESDIKAPSVNTSLPVWARDDVYEMCSIGVFDEPYDEITRDDTITRRECAAYLYKLMNM